MTTRALEWLAEWLDHHITSEPGDAAAGQTIEQLTEQCLIAMIGAGYAPGDIEPDAGAPLESIISDACASSLIAQAGRAPA